MGSKLDGMQVDTFAGKFGGSFDMEEDLGSGIDFDDVACFLVVGTADKAAHEITKGGDVKRTNTFTVTSATYLDPDFATKVLNTLKESVDGMNAGQLGFVVDGSGALQPEQPITAGLDDDDFYEAPQTPAPKPDAALDSFLYGDQA